MFGGQELKYPVDWQFRIITEQQCHPGIIDELQKVLTAFQVVNPLSIGRESQNGKYLTCQVKVSFPTREYMESLSAALAAVSGVKMVL